VREYYERRAAEYDAPSYGGLPASARPDLARARACGLLRRVVGTSRRSPMMCSVGTHIDPDQATQRSGVVKPGALQSA
jgi:hypothetical protein